MRRGKGYPGGYGVKMGAAWGKKGAGKRLPNVRKALEPSQMTLPMALPWHVPFGMPAYDRAQYLTLGSLDKSVISAPLNHAGHDPKGSQTMRDYAKSLAASGTGSKRRGDRSGGPD